jgi:hypothetical protein
LETVVRRHAVWACVVLAYLVVFPYFERLNNPNENVRIWLTRSIAAHGTLAIDAVEREWGEVSDRATDGHRHFSGKAPGTSLLGVPVAFLHDKLAAAAPSKRTTTWALRVFTVVLPLGFFLLVFARAVERETGSPAARDLLVLGLGLGTMMYPYGLAFVGHAQSAALLFGGFLAVRAGRPALAGLLVGLSVVFEYQALFAALAVAGYAAYVFRRRSWRFAVGGLGPALLLAWYHTALFGRPWETPLGHVEDPVFRMYHGQGMLGFTEPRLSVVASSLFSVKYGGLFVWSPLLLAGLGGVVVGLARGREGRAERVVIVAVTLVMILFLSGLTNWRGGWCAGGPRYIAVVVPFLVWGVALSWNFWQRHALAGAALGGLVLASVAACLLAGAHFPHYPLQLDDPLFDLTLPLMGDGYAPYSLGTLVGLRGLVSYLPLALAVVAAIVLALRPLGKSAAISVAVAVAFLVALGLANGRRTADERHAVEFVRGVWEPR